MAQLVDLVKPGPSGTVASTAAVATAAHAALVSAATDVVPAGLLGTVAAANHAAKSRKPISTVMQVGVPNVCWRSPGSISRQKPCTARYLQDLLRAAEKALASGLGDWHLQSIQDISPEFEQHVLMGALGPETLKHKHRLPEPQILHVYGLLHRHCTGFQQEVATATAGAEHREQLLAGIWTAFAQLWDECVQVGATPAQPAAEASWYCTPRQQLAVSVDANGPCCRPAPEKCFVDSSSVTCS